MNFVVNNAKVYLCTIYTYEAAPFLGLRKLQCSVGKLSPGGLPPLAEGIQHLCVINNGFARTGLLAIPLQNQMSLQHCSIEFDTFSCHC